MKPRAGEPNSTFHRSLRGLGWIGLVVMLLHLVLLDWFAGALDHGTLLKATADPMFTRIIEPEAPAAPVPPKPRPPAPKKPPPPPEGGFTTSLPGPAPAASVPEAATPTVAQAPAPTELPASAPLPDPLPASASASASAPSPPVAAALRLDSWPTDTRLSYRLSGMYRGELYGDARVQWQREGANYQVRLDVDITLFGSLVMTSQGEVTEAGLMPRAYEETRTGRRRGARFGERAIHLENGKVAERPEGVQDTASQFVELAHRFATGQDALEVGRTVSFWMARPGAVDLWTYDITQRVTLATPQLGPVEAFHLKPRPIANPRGNVTAEMWFAPSLQYLPVRIRVNMGEEAWLDLLVDRIEQR